MINSGKLFNHNGAYICDILYTLNTTEASRIQFGSLSFDENLNLPHGSSLILEVEDGTRLSIHLTDRGVTFRVD